MGSFMDFSGISNKITKCYKTKWRLKWGVRTEIIDTFGIDTMGWRETQVIFGQLEEDLDTKIVYVAVLGV